MLSTAAIIGRGLALPPGAPPNLVAPLRAAFWSTVSDPDFKAGAKKRKLPVIPIKGAELQKTIGDAIKAMSPTVIAKARKYVFGK
jgi:tripartite-type tricarboxylate transporter receptor subunit TctC